MELELSLGDSPAPVKANVTSAPVLTRACDGEDHDLVLRLGVRAMEGSNQENQMTSIAQEETAEGEDNEACPEPPVRASFGCPLRQAYAQTGSANSEVCRCGFNVNVPVDGRASVARSLSSLSMQMEVPVIQAVDEEASEDEENGGGRVRKKLRLSKEQSAFLEDSFKEHSTLTLEQKSNLAYRLSLRPRQVEVWFQNRRARTKLKQTEVDCEYLKCYCETLAQENRRLQREVAELRAYRPPYPHYNHHLSRVSTMLRACPSCDSKASPSTNYPSPSPIPPSPPCHLQDQVDRHHR